MDPSRIESLEAMQPPAFADELSTFIHCLQVDGPLASRLCSGILRAERCTLRSLQNCG